MPSSDGSDDLVGLLGPLEGAGVGTGFCQVSVDCCLQFDDGAERAAFEPPPGQPSEETFDGVEPRGGRGREVKGPSLVPRKPGTDLGMLVSGIVIDNGVDQLAGRHFALNSVQEADELLVAVALHAASDDTAIQCVEGGEQRGGAMPFVVVCHGAAAPLLHWQSRLATVERLDLALW